jgi:hypothetical protein
MIMAKLTHPPGSVPGGVVSIITVERAQTCTNLDDVLDRWESQHSPYKQECAREAEASV